MAQPQRFEAQQNPAETKDLLQRETLCPDKNPLGQQPSTVAVEPHDPAGPHQPEELKSAAGKPSAPAGKPPVLVVTPRAPAKPLLPGGPCENPFCGVVEAPQWRRIDKKLVCNRCGMYWHRHAQFPDASYFSGLASKQAVRHIVVMHRSRQGASPSGSTPPAPQSQHQELQEQDKAPAGNRSNNQSAAQQAQLQHKAPGHDTAMATPARSPETDSRGSATTTATVNNETQGAGSILADGRSSSNNKKKNDKESSGENQDKAKNVSDNGTAGGGVRMSAASLDQDVILKVLTKQWGQLDASTVWRVHVMLEQLQQELHQQQQLQLLQQQLLQHMQQHKLIQSSRDRLDARSGPPPLPGPAAVGGLSAEAVVRTQVLVREGEQAAMCADLADAAGGRWPALSQSQRPPRQHQRQQRNGGSSGAAAPMVGAGVTEVDHSLSESLQSHVFRRRQGPGSAQAPTWLSPRDGQPPSNHPAQPVLKQQVLNVASAGGGLMGGSSAAQRETSGGALVVPTLGPSGLGQDVASGPTPAAVSSGVQGEGNQRRLSRSVPARTGTEGCSEQRPPKRARGAGQTQMSPPRSASQELLLPPLLASVVQHNKAVRDAPEQQQEQQEQQQQHAHAAHQQRQQKQMQQRSEASFGAASGAGPGRSLLETIAQVAQQQRTQTPYHQQQQQQQQQRRRPEHHQKRRRASEDEDADGRDEAMDWSYGTIIGYEAAPATGGGPRAGGSGGILMRDLQHRALLIQQQRSSGSRHGRGASDGQDQRGIASVGAPGQQGNSPTGAGVSRSVLYNIAGDPYDVGRSHVQGLPFKAAAGVGAAARSALAPPLTAPYGGAPQGLDAAGMGPSRGTSSYVDNILMDVVLSRGGSLKAKVVQQLHQQLQAQGLPIEALPHAYAPAGVLGGVRQTSGAGSGLVMMPVLDLGKPPTALAF
ncbi:hypothetical protein Vafri_15235 [Volvox africanus]|nr:hypothetical protein Vafri_15235 [Volvox africanus]